MEAMAPPHRSYVLVSRDQIRHFDRVARAAGRPLPFHLKIDSGMGRLGTRADAAAVMEVLEDLRHARLEGLMTHFASAADYDSPQTTEQVEYFHSMCDQLREAGVDAPIIHTSS